MRERTRMAFDFARLAEYAEFVNGRLDELLPRAEGPSAVLMEAMRYSVKAGGKRVRPYLALRAAEICGAERESAVHAACALECVHTYSLIHDDLPCMDDDDFRRGKPTCHKKFGEAAALLAGDALLTLAFELAASAPLPPERTSAVVRVLAERAGWKGMVGGQTADMLYEKEPPAEETVSFIHAHKTADLLTAAVLCGGLCAGADDEALGLLESYGFNFGMCFQVTDDILDVVSTSETMGKTVGKDAEAGKQTAVAVYGLDGAREKALEYAKKAAEAASGLGPEAEDLKEFALWLPERKK
ncbi:MAG: polyprenyl synthetase family protein [Planctomycetota bacterium]|nr:MAG: polyprenyl synthetase family protein [Planctomycetota bacterium]